MSGTVSITRRLILTVLLLELLSAVAIVTALAFHERHSQLRAFDTRLQGKAESLMGAVVDAEDAVDSVVLDLRGFQLGRDAVYRVSEENGKLLGQGGGAIALTEVPSDPTFQNITVNGREYRFYSFHGLRVVDPGEPGGGVPHHVVIVYGAPVGQVWHEVLESIGFVAVSTGALLGITALVMVWLVRRQLQPIHDLAQEAERLSSADWQFNAPVSAKQTRELRPLSAALEAALARVQRSFEQQRRFTSDAAHELKTDVAIVKSSLQLLSMRTRTAEEYSQGLALSLDDFTRLEMTVQKLLTLARLEQPVEKGSHSCCLRDVVEEAIHQSGPFAALKTIEMAADLQTAERVSVDSRDALLLCGNIVLNALQHGPEASTVRIVLAAAGSGIQLTVADEGEGIPEADIPFIFEPFYRGDPSRSRKSGGTGLGLSICKAICERVGGSIEIHNRPGGGAMVTVLLPVAAEQSKPVPQDALSV